MLLWESTYQKKMFNEFRSRTQKVQTFHMFLDESNITKDVKLCGSLLTHDIKKTVKIVKNMQETLNCNLPSTRLHFTEILSKDPKLLSQLLTMINSLDFVFDASFIETGKYSINFLQFCSFFEKFVGTDLWNKNVWLYCDRAYSGGIDFSQIEFFGKRHKKGISGIFVPYNNKFQSELKKQTLECDFRKVFQIHLTSMEQTEGIVVCDFLVGCIRQAMKDNPSFLDIVRNKVIRTDFEVNFDGKLIRF